MKRLWIGIFIGSALLLSGCLSTNQMVSTEGLAIWFAADDAATLESNTSGEVIRWKNRVPGGRDATVAKGFLGPKVVAGSLNGKNVLRFTGNEGMISDFLQADDTNGELTVFAVVHRPQKQSDIMWQRILSSYIPGHQNDTHSPGWFADMGKSPEVMQPAIRMFFYDHASRQPFTIGFSNIDGTLKEHLCADVAEILIYNRRMRSYEEVEAVRSYLTRKYSITENTGDNWLRMGPLPPTPKRTSSHLPLSDQQNAGNWKPFLPLWDEFEGDQLDDEKWWDHNPQWHGREPARFLPRNVTVSDGKMHLTFRHEPDLPLDAGSNTYSNWSGASVVSKTGTLYGYFEIKAKAMASSASSAWWFAGRSVNAAGEWYSNELDVFELGGKAKDHEYQYGMNLHVFETPKEKKHRSFVENWIAPFRFIDDYHVYGVRWAKDRIRYYVDGHLVRTAMNTYWQTPQVMIFDSEAMFSWLGVPELEDLPSTYSVEYVRAWTNSTTVGTSDFMLTRTSEELSAITKEVRAFEQKLKAAQGSPISGSGN